VVEETDQVKWLSSVTGGIVSTIVGGLILTALTLFGWKRSVALGLTIWQAFVAGATYRLETPLWAGVVVLAAVVVFGWIAARSRLTPHDRRSELIHAGLAWKITAELRNFRGTPAGALSVQTLDNIVQGPYCPDASCRRPRTASALSAEGRHTLFIEIQCPLCGHVTDSAGLGFGYYPLKRDVFTEAQRQLELKGR
jgi:hypothetical protein